MTSPPIELENGKLVLAVTLTEVTSGTERVLFHREGSRCSFSEDIRHDKYIIVLRVDWGDRRDTEPTLDADVYHLQDGAKGPKLKPTGKSWHHTTLSDDSRCYEFEFKDLHLRLKASKTFGVTTSMSGCIVDLQAIGGNDAA